MPDTPCLILDVTDADQWLGRLGETGLPVVDKPRRIPAGKSPAVLQPSREIAEAEAKRLAREHIGRRFMVFEAVAVGTRIEVPTHVNIRGEVLARRLEPAVLLIGDAPDEVPF